MGRSGASLIRYFFFNLLRVLEQNMHVIGDENSFTSGSVLISCCNSTRLGLDRGDPAVTRYLFVYNHQDLDMMDHVRYRYW